MTMPPGKPLSCLRVGKKYIYMYLYIWKFLLYAVMHLRLYDLY